MHARLFCNKGCLLEYQVWLIQLLTIQYLQATMDWNSDFWSNPSLVKGDQTDKTRWRCMVSLRSATPCHSSILCKRHVIGGRWRHLVGGFTSLPLDGWPRNRLNEFLPNYWMSSNNLVEHSWTLSMILTKFNAETLFQLSRHPGPTWSEDAVLWNREWYCMELLVFNISEASWEKSREVLNKMGM